MRPIVIPNVFDDAWRGQLFAAIRSLQVQGHASIDNGFGRITSGSHLLTAFHHALTAAARELFRSPTLLPTYALWARYDVPTSNLSRHKDDNACTYTLDYCVRQHEPWDIIVEDEAYTLQENEALAFMGEDQEHWRPEFKPGNMVEMIFFHYVEPDHWFFNPDAPRPERFTGFVSKAIPEL